MNCKQDQLAWIVVPRRYYGSGLEQLNGHVVRTIALVPGFPEPTWHVMPRQEVTFTVSALDRSSQHIQAGETRWTHEIPDSFLRPFDPQAEPAPEDVTHELEHTA